MTHKNPLTEKYLERIHSGTASEESKKRRKWSKIILLIDAFFLIIIAGFLFSNKEDAARYTTQFAIENLFIQTSLERSEKANTFYVSLSIKSTATTPQKFTFNKQIGTIELYYDTNKIKSKTIGENFTLLELQPGETKTFIEILDTRQIDLYARNNPGIVISDKVLMFYTDPPHIRIRAVVTLNTGNKVSSILNLKYRLQQEKK